MKLLTVTVPCYNSQDYMENCINSLLKGGERVEVIIIDDGSTDNTGLIADAYAQRYPSIIKVIHQVNGGHGEGINQGIKYAGGIYFKVVDSDDMLSDDFSLFLDKLEECEKNGGVDLAITNYYYVHSDGAGDRSIRYTSSLPEREIFMWKDSRTFKLHQMLTIHSCTFRTEIMRENGEFLPKHVFYEDNFMICKCLPKVRRMYYINIDLYRYWIGRPDQSVQRDVMARRYRHQILITEKCFTSVHLDEIKEAKLKKYMKHELFIMFGIAILFARLNRTAESDSDIEKMWENCIRHDKKWGYHFRDHTPLRLLCISGNFGRRLSGIVYMIVNKIIRFN